MKRRVCRTVTRTVTRSDPRNDVHLFTSQMVVAFIELHNRLVDRLRDDEVIVFDSTGTGLQDVAAAALIYERCRDAGNGLRVGLAR